MTRREMISRLPHAAALPIVAGSLEVPMPEVTIKRLALDRWQVYWTDAEGWHAQDAPTIGVAMAVAQRVLLRDAT